MGYWQTKVVPTIKKVFDKNSGKKIGAAEACKSFDDSKEEFIKVFEEKKAELQSKVIEIYEATTTEIKTLIKERKTSALKKYSAAVEKFLDELSKAEFPGAKPAYEATTKFGATYVSGPIFFVLEKVSTFVVTEEKKEVAVEVPAAAAEKVVTEETTSGTAEKEIVVEEEKKEEVAPPPPEAEKTEAAPVVEEPPKTEECAAAEPPKP